ncbi:MAG: 3-isopropylmalate dehydratase small subunit [Candidatus Thorarchaeota archaeon]|nr:MAG: 3-isopropylmalate dehydratase [Candidatus Thorarchaeota archaeon]RLI59782.1 MAG: 3-isopropylmalate dehydratase [Candidatus Thorarchaeota archaeon]
MNRDLNNITGRVWRFGNDIDTDQIIQGQYLRLLDYSEMAKHTFEIPRPVFASKVKKNDVIVAGRNFGGGSSREEAPKVLLELGVGCVVAESFARIFYRNGFNVGLPLLIVPNVAKLVQDGDVVTVNLMEGTLSIKGKGDVLHGKPLPERMLRLLSAGGAVEWYKQHRRT